LENKNYLHVAFAFDQQFITPFYVLLTSIFLNNKKCKFTFHIIADGVGNEERKTITAFVSHNNCEINFYQIASETVTKFKIPENSHFSSSTYYRIFFPALINPEIKKLLYLDSDIIVLGDLSELYNTPVSLPIGACVDKKIQKRPELGIDEKDKYFNAGVLLINLDEWKRQHISEKTVQFLNDFPEKIKWVDQDALNAVLRNNWHQIPAKYNVTFYDIPEFIPKREFENFLNDKVIIHYTTQNKPWLLTCVNRFRFLYYYYFDKSPYAGKSYFTNISKSRYPFKRFKRLIKEWLIDHTLILQYQKNK
jgi:lipopolysaccharide biosynthesis glycosyltransferase